MTKSEIFRRCAFFDSPTSFAEAALLYQELGG